MARKLPTDSSNKTTSEQKKIRPQRKSLKLDRGYDPSSSDFLESVQRQLINSYRSSTYEGKTEFKAVVLKNVFEGTKAASANDYEVRVRARVDELHSHLPMPTQGDQCAVIDLYPEFIAESEESLGGQPMPGEIITVKFIDRHQTSLKYSNGIILERGLGSKEIFTGLRDSPLLKFIKCKENKKPSDLKPPQGGRLPGSGNPGTGGPVPGGNSGPGGDTPGAAPNPGPSPNPVPGPPGGWSLPPGPQPPPLTPEEILEQKKAEAEAKCDKEYLLGLIRDKVDAPSQIESPEKLIKKIAALVPWGVGAGGNNTVEKIAKLHPSIRLKVAEQFKSLNDDHFIKLIITSGFRTTADSRRIARSGNQWAKTNEGGSWHNYGFAFDCVELPTRHSAYYRDALNAWVGSGGGRNAGNFVPPAREFNSHGPDGKWKDSPVVAAFTSSPTLPGKWGGTFSEADFGRGADWVHFDFRKILYSAGFPNIEAVKESVIVSGNVDKEGYIELYPAKP